MKRLLLLPFILISACSTTKVDDHSYVNIYQHNAEKNQTDLAIASMQKQQQQTYKRKQIRTEEHEEYPVNTYNNRYTQPPRVIRETPPPVDYSRIDEPYIYDPKPTSRNEERSSKALIMPDELGAAYQRSTGNPYVSARLIDPNTLPKPPLYAVYGTTNKIYIMPSDMNRILSGQRVDIDIP